MANLSAFALVALAALSDTCTGCAVDRTHAHVGLGYAVNHDTWQAAVDEWRRASDGRVELVIDAEDATDADVGVGWEAFQPVSACAYTADDVIRMQLPQSKFCELNELTTALHELGHYMGAVHSTNPADVMYPINVGTVALTPADVAQVVP